MSRFHRLLRIDLTARTFTQEEIPADTEGAFVGGKGLLLRYLIEELPAGTDALAPENPLLLATGPFAGTAVATCSRLAVGCKSPATGTLLDSYVGGSFAPELKFAGYDVVIVTGRAAEPVLVRIVDDEVAFLPAAGRYWGLETAALEARIRDEMGPGAKVLSTGPAGENLVPFACLSTDQYHKAGRARKGENRQRPDSGLGERQPRRQQCRRHCSVERCIVEKNRGPEPPVLITRPERHQLS